jgi:hypothetical protein
MQATITRTNSEAGIVCSMSRKGKLQDQRTDREFLCQPQKGSFTEPFYHERGREAQLHCGGSEIWVQPESEGIRRWAISVPKPLSKNTNNSSNK